MLATQRFSYVILALSLLAPACSGKSGGDGSAKSNSSAKADGSSKSDAAAGGTDTAGAKDGLGVTGWYDGCKYTLGAVSYDAKEQRVYIAVEIENLTSTDFTPYTRARLEVDGAVVSEGELTENINIVAKQKVKQKLAFGNLASFDAAKTTLVIGGGSDESIRVPLSGKGPNITNAPVLQAFKGDVVIGPVTYSVAKVEVRWDIVPSGTGTAVTDQAFVTFVGKLKNSSAEHDYYVDASKWSLTVPNGEKVTAEHIGPDGQIARTKSINDYYVIFKIETKGRKFAGDYTLEVTQGWGTDGAEVSATPVKLTIKE